MPPLIVPLGPLASDVDHAGVVAVAQVLHEGGDGGDGGDGAEVALGKARARRRRQAPLRGRRGDRDGGVLVAHEVDGGDRRGLLLDDDRRVRLARAGVERDARRWRPSRWPRAPPPAPQGERGARAGTPGRTNHVRTVTHELRSATPARRVTELGPSPISLPSHRSFLGCGLHPPVRAIDRKDRHERQDQARPRRPRRPAGAGARQRAAIANATAESGSDDSAVENEQGEAADAPDQPGDSEDGDAEAADESGGASADDRGGDGDGELPAAAEQRARAAAEQATGGTADGDAEAADPVEDPEDQPTPSGAAYEVEITKDGQALEGLPRLLVQGDRDPAGRRLTATKGPGATAPGPHPALIRLSSTRA